MRADRADDATRRAARPSVSVRRPRVGRPSRWGTPTTLAAEFVSLPTHLEDARRAQGCTEFRKGIVNSIGHMSALRIRRRSTRTVEDRHLLDQVTFQHSAASAEPRRRSCRQPPSSVRSSPLATSGGKSTVTSIRASQRTSGRASLAGMAAPCSLCESRKRSPLDSSPSQHISKTLGPRRVARSSERESSTRSGTCPHWIRRCSTRSLGSGHLLDQVAFRGSAKPTELRRRSSPRSAHVANSERACDRASRCA